MVYSAEAIADESAAIQRVLDDAFDLRNAAVVDHELSLPARTELAATVAEVVSYGDLSVVVHAWVIGSRGRR